MLGGVQDRRQHFIAYSSEPKKEFNWDQFKKLRITVLSSSNRFDFQDHRMGLSLQVICLLMTGERMRGCLIVQ